MSTAAEAGNPGESGVLAGVVKPGYRLPGVVSLKFVEEFFSALVSGHDFHSLRKID